MKWKLFYKIKTRLLSYIFKYKFLRLIYHSKIIKNYIANGVYSVGKNVFENEKKTNIFFTLKKISFKDIGRPIIIILSGNKKSSFDYADVYLRKQTGKMVFCIENKVISFYKYNTRYNIFDFNYLLNECNYPKCEYEVFDMHYAYNICNFVPGIRLDKQSIKTKVYIAKQILLLNAQAKKFSENMIHKFCKKMIEKYDDSFLHFKWGGYIQHGDLNMTNIICKENSFTIIDFDSINVYPPFFDFFRLIGLDEELFLFFVNGEFDKEYKMVLESINETFSEEKKDKYLAIYIASVGGAIKIKLHLLNDKYIKTNYILQKSLHNDEKKV